MKNTYLRLETLLLVLIIALFLLVQLPAVGGEPWDCFESWRQSDTYSIALYLTGYGTSPLRPQLNYDGADGNYVQLELQLVPYVSALIFRLTGRAAPLVPRLLSLLLFLGSALFLYPVMKRFCGLAAALCGLAVYLFMPLSLLIARAVMPEPCALFFYLGGVYFLDRFRLEKKSRFALAASVMTAVAILEKTPVAFVGLLFIYVFVPVLGRKCLVSPLFYGCGLLTLLPAVLYTLYSGTAAKFKFVEGIATKHIFSEKLLSILTPEAWSFFLTELPESVGWPVLVLSAAGLLLSLERDRRFLAVWAAAFALECATIVAIIKFGYYLSFILPVCAALTAVSLRELWLWRRELAVLALTLTLVFTARMSVRRWSAGVAVDGRIAAAGRFIAESTAADEVVVISDLNPAYLNAADRRGFRANLSYYDYIPTGAKDELDYFIEHGASCFVKIGDGIHNDADGSYGAYLERSFELEADDGLCSLYRLVR